MADYDSQLPIRSEADGTDERVHTKIVDYTDPSGSDKQTEVSEKLLHTRVFGEDNGGTKVQLKLSESGNPNGDGDYNVTTNSKPDSSGVIGHDRDAAPDETNQTQRVSAIGGDNDKTALDVAISDSSGNNFSESNPLPVYNTEDPGDEVDDFDQTTNTAVDAVATHDYAVTALKILKKIEATGSASAKARFELQVETGVGAGTYNTIMTKFNSTANPNVEFSYRKTVAAGIKVRMSKTNLDNQAQDLYSQISGIEV